PLRSTAPVPATHIISPNSRWRIFIFAVSYSRLFFTRNPEPEAKGDNGSPEVIYRCHRQPGGALRLFRNPDTPRQL
ncbi:MAG: hypothetical protein U9N09_03695, partial [Euryarchaeota archaeon]|nr:hypothetical protein [Euryarchaeota archaeon]